MQTTIDAIREAHAAAMRAIHRANLAFGDDPEIDSVRQGGVNP